MKLCAVIMAGGKGERFWPKSRNDMPKQFLSLTGDDKTMIQKTVSRIKPLIPEENIYIVTNHSYIDLVKQQLPDIPAENILTEPMSKNTAPCIALAAAVIAARHGDAIMVVLPSDHLIRYEDMFVDTIRQASDIAIENNNLVTIGIMPTQAETGYGYIKFKPSVEKRGFVYEVEKFVEYVDGSVIAQLGFPTMHIPIQYTLTYPHRLEGIETRSFDFIKAANKRGCSCKIPKIKTELFLLGQ